MSTNSVAHVAGASGAFLSRVLPARGTYIIVLIGRYVKTYAFDDASSAEAFAISRAGTCDAYFACSSYDAHYTASGQPERKADYARAQRALWLDLDCDPAKAASGNAYADKAAALAALQSFLKATRLPCPLLVDSGHGYHAYWCFDRDVATSQWKTLSMLLRRVCERFGLIADHHRTCDCASILRVPGTLNHKRGELLPVSVALDPRKPCDVMALARRLIELAPSGSVSSVSSTPAAAAVPEGMSFSDSYDMPADHLPRDASEMIIKCRQVRELGTSSYPAWMLGLRTVLTTAGAGSVPAPELARALSRRGGDKYDAEGTERTLAALMKERRGAGLCETFAAYEPEKCANCPHRGKVRSPFALCSLQEAESVKLSVVSEDKLDPAASEISVADATKEVTLKAYSDERFQVIAGRGVIFKSIDDNGAQHYTIISRIEVYIHTLCVDATRGGVPKRTYIMRKRAPGCADVDIPFSVEDALGAQKLDVWLAQCGMMPEPRYRKLFLEFMSTYISAVQNKLPEVHVHSHFGWSGWTDRRSGTRYEGFIVGSEIITAAGNQPVMLDDRAGYLTKRLTRSGDLESWKKIPKLYKTLDQKFAQLLMCCAFGAPLMKFGVGTATNVAYSIWDSAGGKGKSSLLKAIASVWGDPSQLLMGRTDTYAARFQQYTVYRNLPILIDEITGIGDSEAADMLYNIVAGREKARSTSTGTGLTNAGFWDTITVFTANQSLYETLRTYKRQSTATSMRVIEARCDFADYAGRPEAEIINDAMITMNTNFGLAGPVFIEYLVRHPAVRDKIVTCAQEFARRYARKADERFWLYGIAIPLYAGAVACSLGLLDYDIPALIDYCAQTLLPQMREAVRSDSPTGGNLLMDFINDNLQDTLIVASNTRRSFEKKKDDPVYATLRKQNVGNPAFLQDPYIVQLPTRHLYIRREYDTGLTYVSSAFLQKWCALHAVSLDTMLTDLAARGLMPKGKDTTTHTLGRDVLSYAQRPQRVFRFLLKPADSNV